ncbi:unnamed protein product [Cunninghamella echinulata]
MAPKKSLADQLANLDNTAPQEPLNNSTLNDNNQSSDEEEKGEKNVRGHYVKVGKSKLRNSQPFLMDDPRYAGQRKSRKDIYSDNEEDDDKDEEEQEDDIMEDDDNDDNISWEGFDQQETLDMNDNEDEDEDESDDEDDEEEDDDDDDEEEEKDNELKEQLLKLQKDEKEMMSQLAKNTSGDIEKGQHVKQQLTLFDNCLESRIRIQKAIELSNQLPQNQQYKEIIENNNEVKEDVLKVRNELRDVIDELMNMRTSLLGENDAIDMDEVSYNTRKRYLDDDGDEDNDEEYIKALWDDISQVNDVFVPFRNSTLEKWSNKVQAASSARLNKKFKAFDQNILTQIDNIMQDKEGLIKRTRLQRADYKILGKKKEEVKQNDKEESTNNKSNRYLDTYDEEIFDDNDFYQQQLRELIESRMVDTDDPIASGMRWAASKKQEIKKKKKNIDTKASKGRKLRFNVHEKIQNFMAPIPAGEWHESMTDELYTSLLGQRKSMMENDELVA